MEARWASCEASKRQGVLRNFFFNLKSFKIVKSYQLFPVTEHVCYTKGRKNYITAKSN